MSRLHGALPPLLGLGARLAQSLALFGLGYWLALRHRRAVMAGSALVVSACALLLGASLWLR